MQASKRIDRRLPTWYGWLPLGLFIFATNVPARGEEKHDLQPVENNAGQFNGSADRVELETRFQEQLSGSNFVGHFTDDLKPGGILTPEKYTLGRSTSCKATVGFSRCESNMATTIWQYPWPCPLCGLAIHRSFNSTGWRCRGLVFSVREC